MRLAENLPLRIGPPPAPGRIVLSEHSPGPGWVELGPVGTVPASSKLLSATARALAQYGPSVPLTWRPPATGTGLRSLTEQADALVASEGLSYREALREASRRDPTAHARWRSQIRPGVR